MRHSIFSVASGLCLCLCLCVTISAAAQQTASDASPAASESALQQADTSNAERAASAQRARPVRPAREEKLEKVTVTSTKLTDVDQRRLSTASKMVFGREELDLAGDSTIGEVLKRLPGVTIGGRPGRGGDIRMRGLGSGYTQVLVNGERPPGGFSMDSLSPDQVERIEIYRAPVAEFSTRAIAGTINVVLREDFQLKQTQLRFSDGIEGGRHAPNLSVTYPGSAGSLNYAMTASVFQNQKRSQVTREELGLDPQGKTILDQNEYDDSSQRVRGIHLTPRLTVRFEGGDVINVQPLLMQSRSETAGNSVLEQIVGPPAPFAVSRWGSHAESLALRMFGNWQHRFENSARLNIKFGGGGGNNKSDTLRRQFGTDGALRNVIADVNDVKDHSATIGGKYTQTLGDGHALATGLDAEWGRRSQNRTSLDNGQPQFIESGETLSAQSRRLAAFVQDEWDITPVWATSLGLRWEGITTLSARTAGDVTNVSKVWSPVAHLVYRIPGFAKDQIRSAVTHSYRAPTLADLIALPSISNNNGPTRPDRLGNPDLKPELSTGIDLAYEHYLTQSGVMSISLFNREIKNLIRRQTNLLMTSSGMRWVSQPFNIGHATTSGLEMEAKFQLQEFLPSGPSMDVRTNVSFFKSKVDGIQGPNNRLDQQPGMTANLGLDYRVASLPMTVGGNLNWTPAYIVQSSATQTTSAHMKRQLDLFGMWKFTPDLQLRISVNNLVNNDYLTGSSIVQGGVNQAVDIGARTYATWTARLEMKI